MRKLKVVTIVGTRPEIIRLSEVIKLLEAHVDHKLVHTGQNYDFELNQVFFDDLKLRPPDYYLGIDTASLGKVLGETLIKIEPILIDEDPDGVLILGDTNASIAAIMAKRLKIPIYHMEAGNRCFDFNVPEEINRRIIDHVADFNLAYTENSRRHLLSEGLPHRHIYVTGSPMFEVLQKNINQIRSSSILENLNLKSKRYFLISAHREENVDHPSNLINIVTILNRLAEAYELPLIVSTHPRTRNRLDALDMNVDHRVRFLKPFGFFDYVCLQIHARCVLSDSGTISEESSILGFPAVTIREATERPEALDAGTIVLSGIQPDNVIAAVRLAMYEYESTGIENWKVCPEYTISNTSWRVLKLILGTAGLVNRWRGIKRPGQISEGRS